MAAAKLSVIFILIIHLQSSYGQQLGLNNQGLGLSTGSSTAQQIWKNGPSPGTINYNQNTKPCNGPALNLQNNKIVPTNNNPNNLQQTQPCKSPQSINLQPQVNSPCNSNPQQALLNPNQKNSLNMPLPINLQQQIFQQMLLEQQQQQFLQQQALQQQSLQYFPQQAALQASFPNDISRASMPIVNGQISGLPSQVSQGILLSNLGLPSNLPFLFPNTCPPKQSVDLNSLVFQQNNAASLSSIPLAIDRSQVAALPVGIPNSQSSPVDCSCMNHPTTTTSLLIPFSLQNSTPQQSQPSVDVTQNFLGSFQSIPSPNQIEIIKSVQPKPSIQCPPDESKPSLSSILLSQMQSPDKMPQFDPSSLLKSQSSNSGSKSSSIKALLPLLFNILKERNGGCSCPPNFNKGMNNFGNNVQEPQIFDGYSNKMNYGKSFDEPSINSIESEEDEITNKRATTKYSKLKNKKNDSAEDEDSGDFYDDEK